VTSVHGAPPARRPTIARQEPVSTRVLIRRVRSNRQRPMGSPPFVRSCHRRREVSTADFRSTCALLVIRFAVDALLRHARMRAFSQRDSDSGGRPHSHASQATREQLRLRAPSMPDGGTGLALTGGRVRGSTRTPLSSGSRIRSTARVPGGAGTARTTRPPGECRRGSVRVEDVLMARVMTGCSGHGSGAAIDVGPADLARPGPGIHAVDRRPLAPAPGALARSCALSGPLKLPRSRSR
jgi:hypothetical protein